MTITEHSAAGSASGKPWLQSGRRPRNAKVTCPPCDGGVDKCRYLRLVDDVGMLVRDSLAELNCQRPASLVLQIGDQKQA